MERATCAPTQLFASWWLSLPLPVFTWLMLVALCSALSLQLASFQGGVDGKTSSSAEATPLPPEQMRPAGPITLAGVRHSYLWLADCLGRPFLISLRHPGLRLRCLAARGEITTARTIAERGGKA
jgi:hypothetical protein